MSLCLHLHLPLRCIPGSESLNTTISPRRLCPPARLNSCLCLQEPGSLPPPGLCTSWAPFLEHPLLTPEHTLGYCQMSGYFLQEAFAAPPRYPRREHSMCPHGPYSRHCNCDAPAPRCPFILSTTAFPALGPEQALCKCTWSEHLRCHSIRISV